MDKKILSLLLTFVLVFTSLTFSVPVTKANADTVYYGDVDCDGRVSIFDALLIRRYCIGYTSLTLDQKRRADVDFNGQITENDATLIHKYSARIINKFEKPLYGDADRDGKVSIEDVSTIQRYLASFTDSIDEVAADADLDGKISITDATYIQRYLVGYFESFEGYTIKYDPNGGSGCMEYQNIGMFDTVKLSPNQFRRTDYVFAGWKIKDDNNDNDNYIKDSNGKDIIFYDRQDASELVSKLNSLGRKIDRRSIITLSAYWEELNPDEIYPGAYLGIYEITPRDALDKCITIAGGSTANYANAQLYSRCNFTYQRFMLRFTGIANCYYIYDTNSNKVLEAESSNITNGTNVRLNQLTGAYNQIWYLENIGNDYYYISSYLNDNYVFDIYNSSTSNGANLQLFEKRGYNNQQFKLNNILDLNKAYRITPRSSSSACVDVKGAGTANGTNVQYYAYNFKPQQQFNFSLQPDGSYVIYSCLSDKVLTVQGDKAQDYANIALYSFENKRSQKWFLQIANNGYYYFASALNRNYVLNIHNGYTSNGTNIELLKKNGGYYQQFKMQEADWTQIDSGTFNLQVLNKRYINFQENVKILDVDYNLAGTFTDENNYGSMFAFERENAKYNIRSMGEYLTYAPSNQLEKSPSNIVPSTYSSEIKWYLECAGNGYYYIHNTKDGKKFIYQNDCIGIFTCFKFIRNGTLVDYDNLINAINRKSTGLRGAYKNTILNIIRENGSKSSTKYGPWKLVCQ